ncbi:MAG: hypothetical protein KGZ54_03735 [Dethiobacter sp.]|jgi:hypothetical protein|nr:hypothetical protein [Dethiobacter sp.]MBS3901115.1 hypothetical protein [Dethiobacter sp.]MBS3990069.1 hypothetical protein [Dethiobacter sp.]
MNIINKLKLLHFAKAIVSVKILIISGSVLMSESSERDNILIMIQQLLLGVFMFLNGTESLVFDKSKLGYIYFIVGVFSIIAFFYRL